MTTNSKGKTMTIPMSFWSKMKMVYPQVMDLFGKWVDGYKKENDWESLFNQQRVPNGSYSSGDGPLKTDYRLILAPKFHDLPVAMQMGIFMQFMAELNPDPEISDDPMSGAETFIDEELNWIESHGGRSR